ncbi:MAG: hypothetical protein CMJ32_03905 [Phycisphaerae bacterium]|nr:hypothetical protein [Phycisphaerae bacterium]
MIREPGKDELLEAVSKLIHGDRHAAVRFLEYTRTTGLGIEAIRSLYNDSGGIEGTVIAVANPGRTTMLFATSPAGEARAEQMGGAIQETIKALDPARTSLVQALVDPRSTWDQKAFLHGGLEQLAVLQYHERAVPRSGSIPEVEATTGVRIGPWNPDQRQLMVDLLGSTYEQTLDCPGLCGLRDGHDILDGHMGVGSFDPAIWLVLWLDQIPAGVIMFSATPASNTLELVYLGLAKAARGQGYGRLLLQAGLHLLSGRKERSIMLAVDKMNTPALGLYASAGFRKSLERIALIHSIDVR